MPYMPTNLYPKNCAINSSDFNVDFFAKLDMSDKIKMYRFQIFEYATNQEKLNFYQYRDKQPVFSSMPITEEQNRRYVLTGASGRILKRIDDNTITITYPYKEGALSEKYYIKNTTVLWKTSVSGSSEEGYLASGEGHMFFNITVSLNDDYIDKKQYVFTIKFNETIDDTIFPSSGTSSFNLFFLPFSVDLSEYSNNFPINTDNEFKLTLTNLNLLLTNGSYYWTLRIAADEYDIWVTDGIIQKAVTSSGEISIFPNQLINEGSHKIYKGTSEDGYQFTIKEDYYDETTTATKIVTTTNETTITLANSIPVTDITDLYVTIDTTTYPVKSISDNTIVATGKHPITSSTIFGQYINVYRKYMTLKTEESNIFNSEDMFTIRSQAIETNMSYFTMINRTLNFISGSDVLNGPVGEYIANYSGGKVDWHQFELYKDNILIDKTEKIYSNKLIYQYDNFYTDEDETIYTLKLIVHDSQNCDIIKTKNISVRYKRLGVSDKLKAYWDENKKAIKIDLTNFISSEATYYKDNKQEKFFDNVASWSQVNEITGLYVNPNCEIKYKEKTEGKVEFPRTSNMLIRFKLDKNKDGKIFDFGNKSFVIKKNQDFGLDFFVFNKDNFELENNKFNIYSNFSDKIIGTLEEKEDKVNTQYYFSKNSNYSLTAETLFSASDVLAENICSVLISQKNEIGTVKVWIDNSDYEAVSFGFDNFQGIIDGLVLYGATWYEFIKVSLNPDLANEGKEEWNAQTLFLTNYQDKQLNVSNSEAYPEDSEKSDILIYKKCDLMGENSQFIYVGKYPYDLTILYDYGVADGHTYTYYITKTYRVYDENTGALKDIKALKEIISQSITPDYYEIDIFGINNQKSLEKDKNIYYIDENEKWYFELDAICDSISFNSESSVYSSSEFARINKTNVDYMSGSATVKLGRIINESEYVGDNRHNLEKFKKFAKSIGIKILRLKDGFIIPVDIQLKQKSNQSNLVGNPTDISFDWFQVADMETCSLVEYEVEQ